MGAGTHAARMTGRVLSKKEGMVCVGGLKIRLDESIPNGISDGEYVFGLPGTVKSNAPIEQRHL